MKNKSKDTIQTLAKTIRSYLDQVERPVRLAQETRLLIIQEETGEATVNRTSSPAAVQMEEKTTLVDRIDLITIARGGKEEGQSRLTQLTEEQQIT